MKWKLTGTRRALALAALLAMAGWHDLPAQTSNTLVRFQIQRGTNTLGSLDVELFDQDKPETVQNFLLYALSGAYSNTFLHRAIPGFIVQGGAFTVTNPASAIRFADFKSVRSLGRLTNEFNAGPRLSNTFGTIAMAKVGGNPDSATSQWFFNLANNSTNLDAQNGGFTVFGRVLESTNLNEGSNVLHHFNTLSTNAGIVNLPPLLGTAYIAFTDLPVAYTNTINRPPNYNELYHVQITILNRTNTTGASPPTITLDSPAQDARFTNQTVTLTGTAGDDVRVARVVFYQPGVTPLDIAAGTTNWTATLTPSPGFNFVSVQSIDNDGNFSTNAPTVRFFYVRTVPLQLEVEGAGRILGLTNGQSLQAGRSYTVTARPGARHYFEGWSGSVTSSSATITFEVPAEATHFSLRATFPIYPFATLAGLYQGVFRATATPTLEDAGYVTMSLSGNREYRGTILHRGGRYNYTGRFDSSGASAVQGVIGGVNRTMTFKLNLTNQNGIISGSLIGGSSTPELQLERVAARLPSTGGPPAGRYTFALTLNTTNEPGERLPGGTGVGTATLDRNGRLRLAGTFGDGTTFTESSRMSFAQRWPVYLPFAAGDGLLVGWLNVATNDPSFIDGSLQWLRKPGPRFATYQAGFTNRLDFLGSAYTPPAPVERVLNWTNATAGLAGGLLQLGLTNQVVLTTNNTLLITDANPTGLNFKLDLKTGRVTGGFNHPWAGTSNTVRGVILQRDDTIRGQFLDGNETGDVHIAPEL